jgi:hypothetical protein
MDLTPLNSPRWQELKYCWSDNRLVESLKILTEETGRSEASIKRLKNSLDTINDSIFHQQSTYPATFITVPILVDACESLPYSLQTWIMDLVSWISAENNPHEELTEAELATWCESLKIAADICENLFRTNYDRDSDRKLMLMGALAKLYGWDITGTRIRHGNEEDFIQCPGCDEEMISQGHIVHYNSELPKEDYLNINADSSPRYLTPIKRMIDLDGDQTPVVPRTKSPEESEVAWLIKLATETGNVKIVGWLQNFFGNGCCPNCGQTIELLYP